MHLNLSFLSRIELSLAVALFIAFCVVFIPAPDHFIRVHDNFDGNFTTRHVLIKSGKFFETDPEAIVPGIMNGLPRGVFPKFTEIVSLLMLMFGSLTGYAINFVMVRLVGFLGVYLFAKDHLQVKEYQKGIVFLTAAIFACLPFSTMHGITVAGIPLILWAFLNLRKHSKVFPSLFVMVIFPLWSNFILVGVHLILFLGFLSVFYSYRDKKWHLKLFLAVAVLTLVYVASEYMLFYMHWFNAGYKSSRAGFEKLLGLNFNGVIGNSMNLFFKGDYSAASYFGYLFIPAFAYLMVRYFSSKDLNSSKGLFFLVCTVVFAVLISVLDWSSFAFFYEKFPIAKEFNLKRFASLLPGFFFLVVVCAFLCIDNKQSWLRASTPLFLTIAFIFVWRGNISFNNSAFNTTGSKVEPGQKTTFEQFFDPELYSEIKKEIGADTSKNVIHLGVSPSPSKYAGLNVLDDYQGDYPMQYKEQFRKVIEGELSKSEKLRKYFDEWGLRCYMQTAALFEGRPQIKNGLLYEEQLAVNTSQLKQMGCNYILSALIVGNAGELNLQLKKVFVSSLDAKKIFLYRIN